MNRILQIISLGTVIAGTTAVVTPNIALAVEPEIPATCSDSIEHLAETVAGLGLSVDSQSDTGMEASSTEVSLTAKCVDEATKIVVETDETGVELTYAVNPRRGFAALMSAEFNASGGVLERQFTFAEGGLSARFDAHLATGQGAAVEFAQTESEFAVTEVEGEPQVINEQLLEVREDSAWRLAHRVMLIMSGVGGDLPVIAGADVEDEVLDWLTTPLPDDALASKEGAIACGSATLVCGCALLVPGCQPAATVCIGGAATCIATTLAFWE